MEAIASPGGKVIKYINIRKTITYVTHQFDMEAIVISEHAQNYGEHLNKVRGAVVFMRKGSGPWKRGAATEGLSL